MLTVLDEGSPEESCWGGGSPFFRRATARTTPRAALGGFLAAFAAALSPPLRALRPLDISWAPVRRRGREPGTGVGARSALVVGVGACGCSAPTGGDRFLAPERVGRGNFTWILLSRRKFAAAVLKGALVAPATRP